MHNTNNIDTRVLYIVIYDKSKSCNLMLLSYAFIRIPGSKTIGGEGLKSETFSISCKQKQV